MLNEQNGELREVGTRKVYHFYFQKWPDKSVPTDPGPLLELIKEVWELSKTFAEPPPVVVHCRLVISLLRQRHTETYLLGLCFAAVLRG